MDEQARTLMQQMKFFKLAGQSGNEQESQMQKMKLRSSMESSAVKTGQNRSKTRPEKNAPIHSSATAPVIAAKRTNGKAEEWTDF
jgi:hypothetical protein